MWKLLTYFFSSLLYLREKVSKYDFNLESRTPLKPILNKRLLLSTSSLLIQVRSNF